MGIISRLRRKLERLAPAEAAGGEAEKRFVFSAELPAGNRGALCRVDLQLLREPQPDGERVQLRAHVQTNFASVLKPALCNTPADASAPSLPSAERTLAPMRRMRRAAGHRLQRLLATPLARRVTEPLLSHDLNTWVEVQASTEPLDDGAHELLPQQEKLAALGIRPSKGRGPVAESWSGRTPCGYAQLSVLQIEKDDLPPDLARRFGAQPFQLAAAIVNTAEKK